MARLCLRLGPTEHFEQRIIPRTRRCNRLLGISGKNASGLRILAEDYRDCCALTSLAPFSVNLRGPRRSCFLFSQARCSCTSTFSSLTTQQQEQLNTYLDFLLEENQKYNLTSVRDRSEAFTRHLLDSLALLEVIEDSINGNDADSIPIIDIGSGPGLPGFVLAVARPHWTVTCMDSMQKRVSFIESAAARAGVPNVVPLCGRAEDLGKAEAHREQYGVAVARAVADTAVLAEYCLPFVAPGGVWVAAKGPAIEEEVERAGAALRELGAAEARVVPVQSHSGDGQRTALVARKMHATPAQYPRRAGMPRKRPIGG